MNVFGFTIVRKKEEEIHSVVPPTNLNDGSYVLDSNVPGGTFGYSFGIDDMFKGEVDLIRKYREVAEQPEVAQAISDICNEAITITENTAPVSINLDSLNVSEPIKTKIATAFDDIFSLLNFSEYGYNIFEHWYVDGKLYYQIILDDDNSEIVELRPIDPRQIKKVKKIERKPLGPGIEVIDSVEEFFVYDQSGISSNMTAGIKLSLDSVVYVPSGIIDITGNLVLSHLHKVIKPINQLRMLEDATVVYFLSRAPERRIFYIDVSGLAKGKAEQYVKNMMDRFRNKMIYDANTGEVINSKKHMTFMEDLWIPRREGKTTEITTLQGGVGLTSMTDNLNFFKNKVYESLNVPLGRLQPDQNTFSLGRASEITRDEVKFSKFVTRLRTQFNTLFFAALKIQLIARGVISESDWDEVKAKIRFEYAQDNNFAELKQIEIINNRIAAASQIEQLVGKYYSKHWVQKHILMLTDDEIKEIEEEIKEDSADPNAQPSQDYGQPQYGQQLNYTPPEPTQVDMGSGGNGASANIQQGQEDEQQNQ